MYELIICEKPNAAKRIAESLADGKPIKENINGVPYYKITHGKKDIVVACAVGHLYGLAEKEKKGWTFPVFDIEWRPASEVSKKSAFSKKYLNAIKKLAKDANEFTVACDYDQEGSVIGKNIIKYSCNQRDAARMKFSTLTKPDLIEAYENKSPHLDWGQIEAGETRHFLDFYNGINYSRALTSAIKAAGSFKIMSTGRVQGPALKIIVDREKEIKAFKPVPFWQIELIGEVSKGNIVAWHHEDKFWEKEKADKVIEKTKGQKSATIGKIDKRQFRQLPPTPFDLTTLQTEAYRCFKISPKNTLSIAQELYTAGYISYPRTSSQKLPPKIGYEKITSALAQQGDYSKLAASLLKKTLKPNEGKKTDPAHPAIFPTGIAPLNLGEQEKKIYDMIVKRFLATFAEPATRETMIIEINCNDEIFIAKGTRTVDRGWHDFYAPYVKLEEVEFPPLNKNDKMKVKKIVLHEEETQPPKRYTPASIIKELEKRNLGTKATRSEIIDTLYKRGYIDGTAIKATDLGAKTIETLERHCPKIVDEALTRHFEEEMEKIREGTMKSDVVLEEAKNAIKKIIGDFKKEEKEIGEELLSAYRGTRDEINFIGKCPACKAGDLQLRKGKFGIFVACNKYPECKTTFSLPGNALIKPAKKDCTVCGFPMVSAIKKGKRPQDFCLNPKCKSKHAEGKAGEEAKAIAKGKLEKPCPTCGKGKLVLKKSIYGSFYACSLYPRCRFTQSLTSSNGD
jgi:DNA topoisomerase-1